MSVVLEDSDIEGDFDPEKYDAKMKKLFGDDVRISLLSCLDCYL